MRVEHGHKDLMSPTAASVLVKGRFGEIKAPHVEFLIPNESILNSLG